ncbi:MAG TPA: EamA family transporter [Lachnospiraceae bacterium]|uniref:DMT family transporter n=1 Tax=Anaerosporobacter sp. TaxID=1872529 RepID=UPI000ED4719E|nr:DMT family transporter [Anaerosporobacter sp.]HAB61905.1 EamA family transporter [Lachnospiraceae bacterium]
MTERKTKEEYLKKTAIVCILAILCCTLWGSAFPAIKLGYQYFEIGGNDSATQILFAGSRFTLAGILTILIGSTMSRKILIPKKQSYRRILVLCLFQTVLQYIFFYIGLANTSGVKAAIINGSNVFVAIIIACVLFRQEKLTWKKMVGCILGFAGVVVINLTKDGLDMHMKFTGEGFILLCTIAYALSSVFIKKYSEDENPVVLSGYQFFVGGVIMMILGAVWGGKLTVITGKGIGMLIYLALVSAVAYSIWGILLKYNPVSKVAIFGFVNPISGVILSSIFLDEKGQSFGLKGILALILVCIGIFVVNYQGSGPKVCSEGKQ